MADDWDVPVGAHLTRSDRMERFGGGSQGGIEPSAVTANVFIYSDPKKASLNGYTFDGWASDDLYLYTGEGRIGDQLLTDGNLALLRADQNGRAIRAFVADGTVPGTNTVNHIYIGQFTLDEEPYLRTDAPDRNGEERAVFVFRLRPTGETLRRPEDTSPSADILLLPAAETVSPGTATTVESETHKAESFDAQGTDGGTRFRVESSLVKAYESHLKKLGHTVARKKVHPPSEVHALLTDTYDVSEDELYEAKGTSTRQAVRLALGQLLDYQRFVKAKAITVLLPSPPPADLVQLLEEHGVGCVWQEASGSFTRA